MTVFRREWLQASRSWADFINPLAFFVIVSCIFPMAVDVSPQELSQMAAGVLWMAVLLAIIIDLPHLFSGDHQDGSIEQWLISPELLTVRVLLRISVHWIFLVVPMLLICPLIGQLYGVEWSQIGFLMLSILLGTPSLLLVGGLISSLLLCARQSGVLLAVLLLPLAVPILIFAVNLGGAHTGSLAALWLLLAVLTLTVSIIPMVIAMALWLSV